MLNNSQIFFNRRAKRNLNLSGAFLVPIPRPVVPVPDFFTPPKEQDPIFKKEEEVSVKTSDRPKEC